MMECKKGNIEYYSVMFWMEETLIWLEYETDKECDRQLLLLFCFLFLNIHSYCPLRCARQIRDVYLFNHLIGWPGQTHTHTHKHQSELTFSRFVRFWIRIDLHKLKRKIRQAYTFFSSFNDMAAVALFCSYRYFAIIIVVAARAITAITAITTSATAVAVAAAVFNKTGILCMGFLILINFNIHIMKWNGSRAVESEWWTNETGKRMNEKRSFVMLRCSHCFLLLFLPPLLLLLLVLVSVFLILSSFFLLLKKRAFTLLFGCDS